MSQPAHPPRIGIRLPSWGNFTREIFAGVVDHMREHRPWRLETPLEITDELPALRIDEDWRGDGLIVFRHRPEEVESWLARGIRVVNFSSESLDPRVPTVTPDNAECGRLAAVHLLGLGLRNFAFWGDPLRNYANERLAGFESELKRHGFDCERLGSVVHRMPPSEKPDRICMEMDRQVARLPRRTGLFAKDDLAALEISRACTRLGLAVPADIAIVGCNNDIVYCHMADTPVTSVRYPGRMIGYRLAETLAALLDGRTDLPARTTVPVPGIVVRESTGISLQSPPVREALAYIRREAPLRPVHVAEVLDLAGAARNTLQRSFREETRETMKAAIDRIRTDRIRDLLARSPLPLKSIADEMRFESPEELSRFFRRTTGLAPGEYRKKHRTGNDLVLHGDLP